MLRLHADRVAALYASHDGSENGLDTKRRSGD